VLPSDIPVWPGTEVEFHSSQMVKYRVHAPVDGVIRFYSTEMLRYGWRPRGGGPLGNGRAVLHYERQEVKASLIVESDHLQRTRVILRLINGSSDPGAEEEA
jgi:hypothetical protein